MTRSQWICNSCGNCFETKGKRDVHHRKEHDKRSTILYFEGLTIRTRHTIDGKLSYVCGRYYQYVQSLNRHRTSCTQWILMERPKFGREQSPEGNISTLLCRGKGKGLRWRDMFSG